MGIVRMGPPEDVVLFLRDKLGIDHFIETGTFRGDTSYWASQNFKHVQSIELSRDLHEEAKRKYQKEGIQFLHGDSRQLLPEICAGLDAPALFWLDAHYCAGKSAGSEDISPLLEEVKAIRKFAQPSCVFVDDARLVLSPPPNPHRIDEYPELWELMGAMSHSGSSYIFLLEDVLISVPDSIRTEMKNFLQKRTTENDRLFWQESRRSDFAKGIELVMRGCRSGLSRFRRKLTGVK